MEDQDPIRFDIGNLDSDERDQLLSELAAEHDSDIAILTDADEELVNKAIDQGISSDEISARSAPNFSAPVDPELILILLETTLILIEGSKLGRVSKQKAAEFIEERGVAPTNNEG